jgi:hypothetical protein
MNSDGAQMIHAEVIEPDVRRARVVIRSVSETFRETAGAGLEATAVGYTTIHAGGNIRMQNMQQPQHTMQVVRAALAEAQVDNVLSRLSQHILTNIPSSSEQRVKDGLSL